MASRGRFIHIDPWGNASLWSQISSSIFWDIWPQVILYTGIAAAVVSVNNLDYIGARISVPSTMLTVLGTVIGFVVSYRTHSAYDRFLEGSKLFGATMHISRNFSRLIWFHVPNTLAPLAEGETEASDHDRAQAIIEKKTVINLIGAHTIALKHYLRGEPGPYYEDLYALTCFLPRYAMPASVSIERPELGLHHQSYNSPEYKNRDPTVSLHPNHHSHAHLEHHGHGGSIFKSPSAQTEDEKTARLHRTSTAPAVVSNSQGAIPEPHRERSWSGSTAVPEHIKPIHVHGLHLRHRSALPSPPLTHGPRSPPQPLLPARNPKPFDIIEDVLPFLEPLRVLYRKFKLKFESEQSRQRRLRKRHNHRLHEDNMPLELQLYFSSYVSLLQRRKILDVPTTTQLLNSIHDLQNVLTGLEKIVTTPIPFAYLVHLKHSTWIYLAVLPFQLERYLRWITIPAVFIAAFMFLGFLGVAAQIEGPFGYDANDLDLDDICQTLARELKEITAHPPAGVDDFIFNKSNEPFYPVDKRSALHLVRQKITTAEVEHTLLVGHERDRGWREIKALHQEGKIPDGKEVHINSINTSSASEQV